MDNNDLGFNISIVMRQTTSTLRLLKSELKSSGYEIKNIQTMLDGNKGTRYIANVKKGFRETKIVVDDTFKSLKNSQGIIKYITKETNDWKNVLGKITIDTGKLYLYWNLTKKIRSTIAGWVTSAIDYNETVNKFNVSMGKSSEQATKFQNRLSEAFGIAKADMMDYQATFKNIMSGLGDISSREAEKVSESLIQMGLDYSSLFNVNQASAMNKMQAALVGSIMPIRRDSGYDVSKNAVSAKIQELGINRTYTQLNETEKRLLRIILLMEQMKRTGAFEDLARTIESPSNQIKVLKNQLQELGVWLGNVFMGTLSRVLPYINGFVMALKEVVKMLAFFVGFTQDTGGLDDILQEADGASSNIADNLGSAASSAKDIKKYLMGFDVLNVIQTPKETGSGAGALDTIDPKILQALKDYDSIMSNVRMKAIDIRDNIMEWLGFTKLINPETGEITWKLKDGYTNLEKILDVAKTIGIALGTWKVASTITNLLSNLGFLSTLQSTQIAFGLTLTLSGIYAQYKGTSHLLDGDIDLFTLLETFLGTSAGAFGIATILKATKLGTSLGFGKSLLVGFGIMLSIQSIQVITKGVEENDIKKQLLGALELGLGTALTISSLTGNIALGLTVGVTVTALVGLTALISDNKKYKDSLSELEAEIKENGDAVYENAKAWNEKKKAIEDSLNADLTEIEYLKNLSNELGVLVDSNNKVKEGYEDRVTFILNQLNESFGTEYKLVDGQITKNGELVDSYQEIKESIAEIIEAKKAEAILDANKELYAEAIKNQSGYYKARQKAVQSNKKAEEELEKALKKSGFTMDDYKKQGISLAGAIALISPEAEELADQLYKTMAAYEESQSILEDAEQTWKYSTEIIIAQENLKTAVLTGDSAKISQAIRDVTNTYETETGKQTLTLAEELDKQFEVRKIANENIRQQGIDLTDELRKSLDIQIINLANNLKKRTQTTEEYTPDIIDAWKKLAEGSEEIYNNTIAEMDTGTQLVLQALVNNVDTSSPEYIQKWYELSKDSVDNYAKALEKLPEDTRKQLQESVNKIDEFGPEYKRGGNNLFNNLESSMTSRKINLANQIEFDSASTERKVTNWGQQVARWFGNGVGNLTIRQEQFTQSGGAIFNVSQLPRRALGGPVETGQMFIAREAGPELVGQIGNTTAVMNNEQIVQAVSRGVASAVASVMGNNQGGASYKLYIDSQELTGVIQERMERNAMITGTN